MRVKEVSYSRVYALDGYQNIKVGAVVEVEGVDVNAALSVAKSIVESQDPELEKKKKEAEYKKELAFHEGVLENPKDYKPDQVAKAAKFIGEYNDLPF